MPFVPLTEQNKMNPSSMWWWFQHMKIWSQTTTTPFLIPSSSLHTMILESSHTPGLCASCILQVANAPVLVWCPRVKTVLHCGLISREKGTNVIFHILALNSLAFQSASVKNNEFTGTSNTWNLFTEPCLSYLTLKHLVLMNLTTKLYISFTWFIMASWDLPETSITYKFDKHAVNVLIQVIS